MPLTRECLHSIILLFAWLSCISPAFAVPTPVIHFQGSVDIAPEGYDGTSYFKFSLIDNAASPTVNAWTNDGTEVPPGLQPEKPVELALKDHLFEVNLGDTTLENMTALQAELLEDKTLMLRTWFSLDGEEFIRLEPDLPLEDILASADGLSTGTGQAPIALHAPGSGRHSSGGLSNTMPPVGVIQRRDSSPSAGQDGDGEGNSTTSDEGFNDSARDSDVPVTSTPPGDTLADKGREDNGHDGHNNGDKDVHSTPLSQTEQESSSDSCQDCGDSGGKDLVDEILSDTDIVFSPLAPGAPNTGDTPPVIADNGKGDTTNTPPAPERGVAGRLISIAEPASLILIALGLGFLYPGVRLRRRHS